MRPPDLDSPQCGRYSRRDAQPIRSNNTLRSPTPPIRALRVTIKSCSGSFLLLFISGQRPRTGHTIIRGGARSDPLPVKAVLSVRSSMLALRLVEYVVVGELMFCAIWATTRRGRERKELG